MIVVAFSALTQIAVGAAACGGKDDENTGGTCEKYAEAVFLGLVDNDNIDEVSGMAISKKNAGVIWMHNDSGHSPSIYAVNESRKYLGAAILEKIEQVDWEDLSLGPCGDDECLFVADIGDNDAERKSVKLYRFVEPDVDAQKEFGSLLITDFTAYTMYYRDKPRDAEGLAVFPDGTVYLFSKEEGQCNVFKIPELLPASDIGLEYAGHLALEGGEMATAADFSRDGRSLLLQTNEGVYQWRAEESDTSLDDILAATRETVAVDNQVQGEAAAYDPRTGHIFYSAETGDDSGPPLYEISCAQ